MVQRITIIGAGAMGCMHGVHLAAAGHDVTLIDVRAELVEGINRDGLQIDGVRGLHSASVPAVTAGAATGPADLVILLSHTDGTTEAADLAAKLLGSSGYALTLQNGIGNVEALADALGPQRVLGGISYNSVTLNAPGRVTHTNPGLTVIGELDGGKTKRADGLCQILTEAGFDTQISDNITGVIWNKFIQCCAIHPICALTGLMAGEIVGVPEAAALLDRTCQEALAVVRAKGVRLPDDDPVGTIKKLCSTVLVKPSMLQHVERGQPTEIDAQNGALVREGAALGVDTPTNEALTIMVKARAAAAAIVMERIPG